MDLDRKGTDLTKTIGAGFDHQSAPKEKSCLSRGHLYLQHVKRFLILILAIQVVSAGYLPAELIKMGNLYQHFMEHREMGGGITLVAFIQLHYFDERHEGSDPQNHERLPLHQTGHLLTIVTQQVEEPVTIGISRIDDRKSYALPREFALPSGNPAAVFQPPRLS